MDHLFTEIKFDPNINEINCDMDGVVADFDAFVFINMGRTFSHQAGPGADAEMWNFLSKYERLYYVLPSMPYAEELLQTIMAIPAAAKRMLTAIPRRASVPTAEKDKIDWMAERFPHIPLPVVIGPFSRDKWKHVKNPGDILIDDRHDNIQEWIAAGGIGILHDPNDGDRTIRILKEITGQC